MPSGLNDRARLLAPALFFLSGVSALILEAVFVRQLGWIFGSASVATAIVLAAFMGGLALGAALFGRLADRTRSPLALYGILEIGVGLSGAALTWLLSSGREWILVPLRALPQGATQRFVEVAFAFLLLLIPTALMGGSLPALGRYLVRSADRVLAPLGLLYGLNTLGGVCGVYLAGFHLFERVGISASAAYASVLAAMVGLVAFLASRKVPVAEQGASPATSRPTPLQVATLIAVLLGGLAVLGYEVIWTRLLMLPMRSFSYSFSMMLALFLAGLVLGSLLISLLANRIKKPARLLGLVQCAMGAWVATSLLWMPARLLPPGSEESSSFGEFLLRSAWLAVPIVLPPTILSGMALPLAVRTMKPSFAKVGGEVGRVYASNTAGAIAGATIAGLVLLPTLGAPRSLAVLAAINVVAGVVMLAAAKAGVFRITSAGVAVAVLATLFLPGERFVESFLKASRGGESIASLVYFHEGSTDTIAVVRKNYGFHDPEAKSLITNGVAMAATVKPVWRYMAMEGHLPPLFSRETNRAMALGVGTGLTLSAVVSHPEVESIVAVELSEGVSEALQYFEPQNRAAYRDPRVDLVVQDGRHYLELNEETFDFITLEPPPPIVAGAGHLYSLDFYELCKARLNDGGTVTQWLPLHAQSLESARMVAGTFLAAFGHVQLWLPSSRDAVLVGSDQPLVLDLARLEAAFRVPNTRENLMEAYLETPEAFLGTYLLDNAGIEEWVAGVPVITDEHPYMEFFRHQGGNMGDRDIGTLLKPRQANWDWVEGLRDRPDLLQEVITENRALRMHVVSKVTGEAEAGARAAQLSRGTEYLLYTFGCTTRQLADLEAMEGQPDRTGKRRWTRERIDRHRMRCMRNFPEDR